MLSQQMHKFMYVIQNSMIVWEKWQEVYVWQIKFWHVREKFILVI